MNRDVIIACDFADRASTLAFLDQFTDVKPFVKIGMELFYAEGRRSSARSSGAATGSFSTSSCATSRTRS